ncbi:MAG TPA: acetylornithine deacetylase, partial [Methylomirabilota bacterium]|nr:acetylornithine deacetylase [Methylomirabilota bacterium]
MIPPVDAGALRTLLRDLVAINSVNPGLVPGARGEKEAAEFLARFLQQHGIPAELQEAAHGRP